MIVLLVILLNVFTSYGETITCPVPFQFANANIETNSLVELNLSVVHHFFDDSASFPVIFAASGNTRFGKSTTLNLFTKYLLKEEVWLNCRSMFGTSHGTKTFTAGVWAWLLPSSHTKDGLSYLLFDTEGLYFSHEGSTLESNIRLCSFAMIASDVSIYLVKKILSTSELDYLSVVSMLVEWVNKDGMSQDEMICSPSQRHCPSLTLPEVIVLDSNDEMWINELIETELYSSLYDSRQDNQRLLKFFHSSGHEKYLKYLEKYVWSMQFLPSAGESARIYRDLPNSANESLVMENEPSYLEELHTVFRSWCEKAKLVSAANQKQPSQLSPYLEKLSVELNKQPVAADLSADAIQSSIKIKLKQQIKALLEQFFATFQTQLQWPVTDAVIDSFDPCPNEGCLQRVKRQFSINDEELRILKVDILQITQEYKKDLFVSNKFKFSEALRVAEKKSRAAIEDLYKDQSMSLCYKIMELYEILIPLVPDHFVNLPFHAKDLNYHELYVQMDDCSNCLKAVEALNDPKRYGKSMDVELVSKVLHDLNRLIATHRCTLYTKAVKEREVCQSVVTNEKFLSLCNVLINYDDKVETRSKWCAVNR